MEQGGNGFSQVEQCHRAPGDMKRIEEREGAGCALSIKHLTQNHSRAWILRVADEYRFTTEVAHGGSLIDVICCTLGPIRMDELIEKFPSGTTRGANAEHPEIMDGNVTCRDRAQGSQVPGDSQARAVRRWCDFAGQPRSGPVALPPPR